ncbi:GNAT family N-acetyltransferase [Polycladidibacter stylochi]|uniref:GNAT family N-acetyltransferase n=1 Tax=Polycladidibacter stylochi TaxID=1807766 RepID=UPI00082DE246|nr:N-acetyltransferase [Pseudovibrio stylochi]
MKNPCWFIRAEEAQDAVAIEHIQEEAFGPGRFVRTAARLREGVACDMQLSFTGLIHGEIAGSVRLTPITIGEQAAMLLGPLAVRPPYKSKGLGRALLHTAHMAAKERGVSAVLLVGDYAYYGPHGYAQVPIGQIGLGGPVDPNRILVHLPNGGPIPQGKVRKVKVG